MKTIPAFDIQADYDRIHRTFPGYKTAPVIGLTGNFQDGNCMLAEGYYQSILKAGGTPFIIPCYDDSIDIYKWVETEGGQADHLDNLYKSLCCVGIATNRDKD